MIAEIADTDTETDIAENITTQPPSPRQLLSQTKTNDNTDTAVGCTCTPEQKEKQEQDEKIEQFATELFENFQKVHSANFDKFQKNTTQNIAVFSKTKYVFKKIQIIDDISVNVELKSIVNYKTNFHKLYLHIFTKKIFNENNSISLYRSENYEAFYSEPELSLNGMKICIKKIITILPNLRFVKSMGVLVENKYNEPFGEEYLAGIECSVCLEKTITQTNCSHPLCLQCWSKIKKNKCPICRSSNIYVLEDEDDDINLHYDDDYDEYDEDEEEDDDEDEDDDDDDENMIEVLQSNNTRIILTATTTTATNN